MDWNLAIVCCCFVVTLAFITFYFFGALRKAQEQSAEALAFVMSMRFSEQPENHDLAFKVAPEPPTDRREVLYRGSQVAYDSPGALEG
jgi:hypothetical protein